jgi:hypothetical protein
VSAESIRAREEGGAGPWWGGGGSGFAADSSSPAKSETVGLAGAICRGAAQPYFFLCLAMEARGEEGVVRYSCPDGASSISGGSSTSATTQSAPWPLQSMADKAAATQPP